MSPTQYLGMAESDLYLLATSGNFGQNFMKGLFGIWLQAMVLTAIGVFAGTFLSWPVALLDHDRLLRRRPARVQLPARLLPPGHHRRRAVRVADPAGHARQPDDRLAPTAGVVVAKTLDSIVMPVMSRLVYLVPNFQALDVSNTVAEGFAVSWP